MKNDVQSNISNRVFILHFICYLDFKFLKRCVLLFISLFIIFLFESLSFIVAQSICHKQHFDLQLISDNQVRIIESFTFSGVLEVVLFKVFVCDQ